MNKTDMLKDAHHMDEMGVDPDLVMLQSVEEYSESYGDEVDTYDEDKLAINRVTQDIDECTYEIADLENQIRELTAKIAEYDATIDRMQRNVATTRNWAMKMEYENFIKGEEKERGTCLGQRDLLVQKRDLLIAKRDKLAEELHKLRESFDSNYGSRNVNF